MNQLRRKSFLVLEPTQAGLVFVCLVRNQAAVQIIAHDQAVVKAPVQSIARQQAAVVRAGGRMLFAEQVETDCGLRFAHSSSAERE